MYTHSNCSYGVLSAVAEQWRNCGQQGKGSLLFSKTYRSSLRPTQYSTSCAIDSMGSFLRGKVAGA